MCLFAIIDLFYNKFIIFDLVRLEPEQLFTL